MQYHNTIQLVTPSIVKSKSCNKRIFTFKTISKGSLYSVFAKDAEIAKQIMVSYKLGDFVLVRMS
jgi:hypothetical protein